MKKKGNFWFNILIIIIQFSKKIIMEALENIPEPPKIRVVVRKRPMTQREGQSQDIIDVEGVGELIVKEIKWVKFLLKVRQFAPEDLSLHFFFLHNFHELLNSKPLVSNLFHVGWKSIWRSILRSTCSPLIMLTTMMLIISVFTRNASCRSSLKLLKARKRPVLLMDRLAVGKHSRWWGLVTGRFLACTCSLHMTSSSCWTCTLTSSSIFPFTRYTAGSCSTCWITGKRSHVEKMENNKWIL